MVVQQYLDILARRKWVILLVTLTALAVAIIGSYLQHPTYTASVTVRVAQASIAGADYAEYYYAERLLNTYAEIIKSRPFLAEAIDRLGLPVTPENLNQRIKVDLILNTELIKVSVDDAQPANAAAIANMLASLLVERSQDLLFGGAKSARALLEEQLTVAEDNLERDRGALQALLTHSAEDQDRIEEQRTKIQLDEEIYANLLRQYEDARISEASRANSVTITEPAVAPKKPSKPRLFLNVALSLLLGLCASLVLAFVVETLDVSLHSVADLEAVARAAVVGVLPQVDRPWRKRKQPLLFAFQADQPGVEAYRLLRARIFSGTQTKPPKTLLVTSPEAGAGKSTVSANLAMVMAEAGHKVILVDADLRRSSLHRLFGLPNKLGLKDLLVGSADLDTVLLSSSNPNLQILTTGVLPSNPTELLGSERMRVIIRQLAARAAVVVIDSPPLLAVADGALLASQVDGVLLVAARDETTRKRAETAFQLLEKMGAQVLGVVFNKSQGDERYYYYRYSARAKRSKDSARIGLGPAIVVAGLVVLVVLAGIGWMLVSSGLKSAIRLDFLIPSTPALGGENVAPATDDLVGTPEPTIAGGALVTPTHTPLLPRSAFIASAAQGLSDGIFLYEDPITAVPGRVWLPAGSPIQVLEVDIYGRVYYGTRRWYLVQCVVDDRTYVGYVPATLVTWRP